MSMSFNTQQNKSKKFSFFAVRYVTVHSQFWVHSPSHKHRAVHSSTAFLHLQRFTQPFLHLHENSSLQVWAACGNLVQLGSYSPSSHLVLFTYFSTAYLLLPTVCHDPQF